MSVDPTLKLPTFSIRGLRLTERVVELTTGILHPFRRHRNTTEEETSVDTLALLVSLQCMASMASTGSHILQAIWEGQKVHTCVCVYVSM